MNSLSIRTRRDFVRVGLASAAAAGAWAAIPGTARAAGGTVNFADIGVGDPGGDSVMGPVISSAQWTKIQGLIKKGMEEGATVVAGEVLATIE